MTGTVENVKKSRKKTKNNGTTAKKMRKQSGIKTKKKTNSEKKDDKKTKKNETRPKKNKTNTNIFCFFSLRFGFGSVSILNSFCFLFHFIFLSFYIKCL